MFVLELHRSMHLSWHIDVRRVVKMLDGADPGDIGQWISSGLVGCLSMELMPWWRSV